MTPTPKLRFVGREVQMPAPELGPNFIKTIEVRVLQQWWAWQNVPVHGGEWRDVPLEKEK